MVPIARLKCSHQDLKLTAKGGFDWHEPRNFENTLNKGKAILVVWVFLVPQSWENLNFH